MDYGEVDRTAKSYRLISDLSLARTSKRSRSRQVKAGEKAGHGGAFTIAHEDFDRISAVEGLSPTKEALARSAEFDRKGLSWEERHRAIIEAHRPKG